MYVLHLTLTHLVALLCNILTYYYYYYYLFYCRPKPTAILADPGGGGDAKRSTYLERMCSEAEREVVQCRRGTVGTP